MLSPALTPKPPKLTDSDMNAQRTAFWNPYNVRQGREAGDSEFNFLGAGYKGALDQFNFGTAMEPGREAYLKSQIDQWSNPANKGNLISQFGQQRAGEANDAARAIWQHLSKNPGVGAQQGAGIAALNQGRQATTDFASHLNSPEGMQQIHSYLSQLYGEAQATNLFQQIWPIISEMNQSKLARDSRQGQGGLLNTLAPLAGQFLAGPAGGAIAGSMFGGGGGGGAIPGLFSGARPGTFGVGGH